MELKIPPHNIEAEQAVLGGCLLNPKIIPHVSGILRSNDFYREAHLFLFDAICQIGQDVDLVMLGNYLEKKNVLEKCGGNKYLGLLVDNISTSVGYEHWCNIIKEESNRRKIINLCSVVVEKCFQNWSLRIGYNT